MIEETPTSEKIKLTRVIKALRTALSNQKADLLALAEVLDRAILD